MEVIQANVRERLSVEQKGCVEEESWSEMALGGPDSHPELGRAYGSGMGGGAPPREGGEQRACR